MAHEKAKGQQAEKLFLGSLRASRAIKNYVDKMRQVGGQSNVHYCPRNVGRQSVQCLRGPKTKWHKKNPGQKEEIIYKRFIS